MIQSEKGKRKSYIGCNINGPPPIQRKKAEEAFCKIKKSREDLGGKGVNTYSRRRTRRRGPTFLLVSYY